MRKPADGKPLEGKIQHHGNFAFLLSETPGGEDIMLRGPTLRLAMEGDRVQVRLSPGNKGRPAGEIVRVVERARATVTGVLFERAGRWFVLPEDGGENDAVLVLAFEGELAPRPGLVAVIRITQWPTMEARAGGQVCEVLGMRGEPGVRVRAVLRGRGLPDAFPEAVLAESRAFPERVSPDMWEGRLDLRSLPVFTIDGADAKDFDDAVSLEPLGPERMRLGVHIADVSRYVKPGTRLDAEAAERATSVYLADRVVPMLPPNLSDHLCSLMPGVERLTLSCFMDLDVRGNVRESSFQETVIKSRRRFTYEEVEALLTGEAVPDVDEEVSASVLRMGKVFRFLHALRLHRGALDLSCSEYKVQVDAEGRPLAVVKRERLDSHRLIEEFMLLANETVAAALLKRRIPFLSRIHPDPDPRKLSILTAELFKLGFKAPNLAGRPAAGMQAVLRDAAGKPLEEMVSMLLMRSLKQASYSPEPGGHFGLASPAYCHFTSPIRRYPDLVTHRAVKALLRGEPGAELSAGLPKLGAHCSERERLAADAERRSVDILRAELLKKREGQTFEGVVSGSAAFGIFVTLKDLGASGLVRNAAAALGTRVQVKLERVNEDQGELDLSLIGPDKSAWEKPKDGPRGQRRPDAGKPRWDKPKFDPSKAKSDKPKWDANRPRWEKPKFDPNKPRPDRPRFDPNKPRWEKPKWDPNKPRPDKPRFDPNKPRWEKPGQRMDTRKGPDAGKPWWKKPKFDPNKPRPEKPRFDPSKAKWEKPKWDSNKPRPDKPRFDPNKPKSFGPGKPRWEKPKFDPNKPRPPQDPNRPKFDPNRPKPRGDFRRPKPRSGPFHRG